MAHEIVHIAGPSWKLDVWPALGAVLVGASARREADWLVVTPPVDAATLAERDILKLGGFPLAPFCNRIEGGRFDFEGAGCKVPLNWPPDPSVAIHGLSWQRSWATDSHTADRLMLSQTIDEEYSAFRYAAELTFDVATEVAQTELTIRNIGERKLPFGVGFHPYFRRTPQAVVAFETDGWLEPDARCLPVAWHPLGSAQDARAGRLVDAFSGTDATFTGWKQRAWLSWPELGARIELEAGGAARALHAYVPDGRTFLCLEPVSHVTDVMNRRQFARYGDMDVLAPGAALGISMSWRLAAIGAEV